MNIFSKLKTDPHFFEIKGKSYRVSASNGLYEASFQLSQSDRDEFERRSRDIEDELKHKLDIVAAAHDEAVSNAKATARAAHEEARIASEAAKWKLAGDFFRLPTREQIAIAETPVGQVVRAPKLTPTQAAVLAGPDYIAPVAEPQAV